MQHTSRPPAGHGLENYQNFIRLAGLLCLLALTLTPLIFDPGARDDAFFTPKWAWMACWTALGLALALARAATGRTLVLPISEVWFGAVAFTAWHWVAIFWAASRSLALERALQVTWLLAIVWIGVQFQPKRRALLWLAWAWIAIGTLTALWVLVEDAVHAWWPQYAWIQPNLSDWRGFLAAGLGNTNHIGDLLALTLLPTLAFFGEARKRGVRWLLALAAVIQPAALIVCYSVGSNFGLLAGAGLMAGLVIWRDRGRWFARRWRRWVGLGAAWLLLVAFFVTDHPLNPHRPGILSQGFSSGRWHEGWPTRLAIWAEGLEMVRLHPFLGVGTGNFTYAFPEMNSRLLQDPELLQYQGSWTNAAHNELLQTWDELGIIGLFLFLTLTGLTFHSLLKDLSLCDNRNFLPRVTLAGLLLAWLAHAQMNFALQHPAGALTFFMILRAAITEQRTRRAAPAMPPLRQIFGPLALEVQWRDMRRATGIGLTFVWPRPVGVALGLALLLAVLVWIPVRWRPVLSQHEYQRGTLAERQGLPGAAEAHFKRALDLDANATGARSHYSQWLVDQHRPTDALTQLSLVRQRLNSNELWVRQAQALAQLGRPAEAQQLMETYKKRVWRSQMAPSQAGYTN